ncbi:peptide chain release factor N(5)-glutamine methyltransferase [Aquimarina mytili]|uniref:Release factor glutamine methyltransferase n=1 Tax=Aquimarina mytili TaxID=874423 RepID=A0A936ZQN7_9FLAO|nr:peptide chain release factor N(5)-glutamine methyltransferase [Aquimarina mytili]MBL0682522.1 peptide chain release factor N(5)-glutamine methyltransferase [Aquimarina mytili]
MKIKDLRNNFLNSLSAIYGIEETRSFFYMLSEHIMGLRRVDIAVHLEKKLPEAEMVSFADATDRLKKQEPIQYIIGEANFYGLDFSVNSHVLIPRPETEELVDWIIKNLSTRKEQINILDIGTGSGCIAVSLAKNSPHAKVYALDVSEEAISVAKSNAKKNQVEVTCIQADILKTERLPLDFDVIVSNPPYVRELEKKEMKANVLDNEPALALFVADNDPLIFYKRITELAKRSLTPGGSLYFEINQYLGLETKNMIEASGFESVILRKDIYNNDRMIHASIN